MASWQLALRWIPLGRVATDSPPQTSPAIRLFRDRGRSVTKRAGLPCLLRRTCRHFPVRALCCQVAGSREFDNSPRVDCPPWVCSVAVREQRRTGWGGSLEVREDHRTRTLSTMRCGKIAAHPHSTRIGAVTSRGILDISDMKSTRVTTRARFCGENVGGFFCVNFPRLAAPRRFAANRASGSCGDQTPDLRMRSGRFAKRAFPSRSLGTSGRGRARTDFFACHVGGAEFFGVRPKKVAWLAFAIPLLADVKPEAEPSWLRPG
jgi:hypothetical protein